MNRWIGIVCAICMLGANTALILRDVVPRWLAGEPPKSDAGLAANHQRNTQVAIYDAAGRRIGRSWTEASLSGGQLMVRSWTLLKSVRMPSGHATPTLRVDTELSYAEKGTLDRLSIVVHGLGMPVRLSGEDFSDLACEWQVGNTRGKFVLPLEATKALADAIRPFDRLPGLYVGRVWRVRLFNFLEHVPGFSAMTGGDVSGQGLLVEVTGKETITHDGRPVECFVVDTQGARGWVDAEGNVLRQTVDLPVLGRLTLVDEEYDETARKQAQLPVIQTE